MPEPRAPRRLTCMRSRTCCGAAKMLANGTERGATRYQTTAMESAMNQIIWIVGAVVIVLAILGFFGLR